MMANKISNSERIARNTMLLYIRMLFVMGVTLFTSRIILQALGVVDLVYTMSLEAYRVRLFSFLQHYLALHKDI